METMDAFRGHGMDLPADRKEKMYRAQCLKDDTMARTIADCLQAHPDTVVFQVNGGFHSDTGQGVPWKLEVFHPGVTKAVLSTVHLRPCKDRVEDVWQANRQEGEILVLETAHRDP